jgi:hypothetical protein
MVIDHATEYRTDGCFHSAHPSSVTTVTDGARNPLRKRDVFMVTNKTRKLSRGNLLQNPGWQYVFATASATAAEYTVAHRSNDA